MNSLSNRYLVNFGSGFGSDTTGSGSVLDTHLLCKSYTYLLNKIINV